MSVQPTRTAPLRRHLLGLFAVICLAVGLALAIWPSDTASGDFIQGSCIKSGLVLMAAWLAYPQLDRLPGWIFGSLIVGILVVAVRPRIVLILLRVSVFFLPILVLIWILRPKRRGRSLPK